MDEKDKAEVQSMLAAALKPVADAVAPLSESVKTLTANQKILADTLKELPPAPVKGADTKPESDGKPDGAKQPLSMEDLNKALDERDARRTKSAALDAQRRDFLAAKGGKLPARYQQLGDDPAKWDAEISAAQASWEKDFTAAGGKIADVAPPPATGKPPATSLDASKLTQEQFAAQFLPKAPGTSPAQEEKTAAATAALVAA